MQLIRFTLNTLKEAKEFAALKEKQGFKNVHIMPHYVDGAERGHSVYWKEKE